MSCPCLERGACPMDRMPAALDRINGRLAALEALARVTVRWATGTAEPTMLRDAGRLVALEARVALMELTIKLDEAQMALLSEVMGGKVTAALRRHLKRHHHIKQKKLKGG